MTWQVKPSMHSSLSNRKYFWSYQEKKRKNWWTIHIILSEFKYDNEAALNKELVLQVRKVIGPFAAPKKIFIIGDLPKTRSGKIMRRIMRKIVAGEGDQLGDLSTLADPSVVDMIKKKVAESAVWCGGEMGEENGGWWLFEFVSWYPLFFCCIYLVLFSEFKSAAVFIKILYKVPL